MNVSYELLDSMYKASLEAADGNIFINELLNGDNAKDILLDTKQSLEQNVLVFRYINKEDINNLKSGTYKLFTSDRLIFDIHIPYFDKPLTFVEPVFDKVMRYELISRRINNKYNLN